jgi:hypothetical protein
VTRSWQPCLSIGAQGDDSPVTVRTPTITSRRCGIEEDETNQHLGQRALDHM